MPKKRIIGLIMSFFITTGVILFSRPFNNASMAKADGDELIGTPNVSWNNIDYSADFHWVPNTSASHIPQEGYCLLAQYPANIASAQYVTENLVTTSMANCNVSDHVYINGEVISSVQDVVVYCYPENGIFFYIPHNSVNFSEEYEYVTVEIQEGLSIDGTAATVATRFEYRGLLGSYGNWLVNPDPIVKIQGEFNSISWNNTDYSYTAHQEWSGDLSPTGSPLNGYCLLAFFNEEGKSYSESIIGDVITTGRGVIGKGLNCDYKIKVNGVNIVDVPDTKCYIYPAYGLFFYLPEASLTYNDQYKIPTIEMEKGVNFNNVYLPEITFEFKGELGSSGGWTYRKPASEYNHFPFVKVADLWNNTQADSNHNNSILQFGEYEVDYLKKDGVATGENLVNALSDVGTKITINGIPLCEIEETSASYIHGYCYFYFAYPTSALVPSNGYKVVTFHIEEGTVFYDTMFPEVSLYLFNGKWILEKPETPEDSDYDDVLTFSSTFGVDQATLDKDNRQLSSSKDCSINDFGLFLDYKLVTSDSSFVLFALGNRNQNGLRVVFNGNTLSLYDATESSFLLGNASLAVFNEDEWYSLFLYTKVIENKLSIYIAIDDITYIHVDDVALANKDNIGNMFSLNLGNGEASFKNATLGGDNKKPVLTYTGKSVYGVLSGSEVIDFSNKCSAYDAKDGNVSSLITYNWPEGSITNNKINKGLWDIRITAEDKSHNTSSIIVTVIANDKLDVTVTFDGMNPVIYRIGDHIAPVADPVKEGEGTTYKFIGWYYNDRLWDFENDYVISDMDLVSKYQETTEEHCVSFTIEGLKDTRGFNLYFKHGTQLSMETFNREGYSLKAYVNDEEVTSITVNEDMSVKLVYTDVSPKKKGCGGEIASSSLLIPLFAGVSLILLVILRKKGGKEHE